MKNSWMKMFTRNRFGRAWGLFGLCILLTAATTQAGDYTYTTNSDNTITITRYIGTGSAVTIPDTINGLPVTCIGAIAFSFCTSMTNVIIPASVTSIAKYAFYQCTSLTSVSIGGSVTSIGDEAFYYCTSLTSVTIPNSVTYLGSETFVFCSSLTNIVIGSSLTSIPDVTFYGCSSLPRITIPAGVTSIGNSAFDHCTSLATITVDGGNSAYSSLDGVLFNTNQTTLILCPGGKAGSVTIPNSVTSIAKYAFYQCSSLTAITVDGSHSTYSSLDGVLFNTNQTTLILCPGGKAGSVTIPGSVTSIGNTAFYYCTKLKSITIPASVTSIGNWALASCTNLTGVYFQGDAPDLGSDVFTYSYPTIYYLAGTMGWGAKFGGQTPSLWNPQTQCAYTINDGKITITGYTGTGDTAAIPETIDGLPVSSIGYEAFRSCTNLASVTIPAGVTNIGHRAFSYCARLISITIANGVIRMGIGAFYGCSNLTNISIPDSVTSIGYGAFAYCTNLTRITLPPDLTIIGSNTFDYCTSLTNVMIGPRVTSIEAYAFAYCASLISITIPDRVTSISEHTFYGCSSLINVTIPDGVTSIGPYAFHSCTSMTNVTIGNSVTNIGLYAFTACTHLTNVIIPDNVTHIGDGAFARCSRLASVTIGSSVASIGTSAFSLCISLDRVYFWGNAPSLGSNVFYGENNATVYYLPGTTGWGATLGGRPTVMITTPTTLSVTPDSQPVGGEAGTTSFSVTNIGAGAAVYSASESEPWLRLTSGSGGNGGLITVAYDINLGIAARTGTVTVIASGTNGSPKRVQVRQENAPPLLSVTPAGQNFGAVQVGSSVDRAFVVQNTGGGILAGTASVPAPFTIASGGPYNLVNGASQTVTVRYSPTGAGTHSQSVSFTGGGGMTRQVSGDTLADDFIFTTNSDNTITIAGYTGRGGAVNIPDTINSRPVTRIGELAFLGCAALTGVTIPSNTISIGRSAFDACTNLANIAIPDRVVSIGDGAFNYCVRLAGIALPAGCTNIGSRAFAGCASLTSITIPSNLTRIAQNMFFGCTSLAKVTIPDRVVNIESVAFGSCAGLTSITLPRSVLRIGSGAFDSCTRLAGVYAQGNAPDVEPEIFYRANNVVVYYLQGTTGWGPTLGGRPTVMITTPTTLFVTPTVRSVGAEAGMTAFAVTNVGVGVTAYSASPSEPWLRITSGSSGGNGGTVTVSYDINPGGIGRTGTVAVIASGTNGSPKNVQVRQAASIIPAISITPASQDFGMVQVGLVADRTFVVQNTGGGTLSGDAWVAAPFRIVSGSPYNLAGGASQTVVVRYSPTIAGTHSQAVRFAGGGATRHVSGKAYIPSVHANSAQVFRVGAPLNAWSWCFVYNYTTANMLAAQDGLTVGTYDLNFSMTKPAQCVGYLFDVATGRYSESMVYIYDGIN